MNAKKYILYIGNYMFPRHNAAGKRVYANCCILRDLGYHVISIGNNSTDSDLMKKSDCIRYEGIDSYSFGYSTGKKRIEYWKYLSKIKELIQELNIENDICSIFVYANLSISLLNIKILKWAHSKNIRCYADCADWFDPPKGSIWLRAGKYIDTNIQMNVFNKLVDGIVCISSFLSEYYKDKHTIIIPPLTNVDKNTILLEEKESVCFVYAGSKFRSGKPIDPIYWKDRLDIMIKGFYEAKLLDPSIKFTFSIIGITESEFVNHLPLKIRKTYIKIIEFLRDEILFFDYLPHDKVEKMICEADYSILMRDKKRMTMVGFPTKIPESISCGTPVIYNDTSDIKKYMSNGKFGCLVDTNSLASTIVKITHMDQKDIYKMKCQCIEHNPFDYKLFLTEVDNFLRCTK